MLDDAASKAASAAGEKLQLMPDLFVLLFSHPDLMIGIRTKMQVRAATYARPLCGHLMLFSSPDLIIYI